MKNNKLTPFKMCVLQNFPFIEADFDALTNYELMCKIVEYLNKVIEQQNITGENVNELLNWFNNLDVQEEVNEKLDKMVEDGTFEELVAKYLKKSNIKMIFPGENYKGDCSLLQYKKDNITKNIIIDFGSANEYVNISNKMAENGITNIDYAFISHFHYDHIGSLDNLLNDNRFDFSNATFYLPAQPDYSKFIGTARYIPEEENRIIQLLNDKGIRFTRASNNTIINIDSETKIKFLNSDVEDFENYYNITYYYDDIGMDATEYNNFSMVLIIEHINNKLLFTGDISQKAQEIIINQGLPICNFIKAPHHDENPQQYLYEKFWKNYYKPEIQVILSTTSKNFLTQVVKSGQTFINENNNTIEVISSGYNLLGNSEKGLENKTTTFSNYMQSQNITGYVDISQGTPDYNIIGENEDLNNYITAGTYRCISADITNTIAHVPFRDLAFKLIVMSLVTENRFIQLLFRNQSSVLYYRYGTKSGNSISWNIWSTFYSMGENILITTNTDLNDITTVGNYFCNSGADATTLINKPSDVSTSFKLTVEHLTNRADRLMQKIVTNEATPKIYIRTNTGTWNSWKKITLTNV